MKREKNIDILVNYNVGINYSLFLLMLISVRKLLIIFSKTFISNNIFFMHKIRAWYLIEGLKNYITYIHENILRVTHSLTIVF